MSTLAERQLAAWQAIAARWDWSPRGPVARCNACGKSIALTRDSQDRPYMYSDDQWLALVVLHLRNFHPDLDPDKPAQTL